jgi:hypothetical protein
VYATADIVYDLGFSCEQCQGLNKKKGIGKKTDLLLLPQSKQTDAGDLDDLESHSWNITLRFTATTEARNEDLVVFVDKVQAPIVLRSSAARLRRKKGGTHGDEGSNLLSVLDELHPDTLPDGRVWLLGLYADLLQDDPFCVGRATGGGGAVDVAKGTFFVGFVRLRAR